jgi:hypothetical protein
VDDPRVHEAIEQDDAVIQVAPPDQVDSGRTREVRRSPSRPMTTSPSNDALRTSTPPHRAATACSAA